MKVWFQLQILIKLGFHLGLEARGTLQDITGDEITRYEADEVSMFIVRLNIKHEVGTTITEVTFTNGTTMRRTSSHAKIRDCIR
ncbi:hypothetical protein L2E82_29682 [Cichorium intybus]|uniref:Uncharacterized protein n=1 Tax=Cichorium intybus TaxID=13427 RepID=A0ACB9CYI3_CICIN|nr:hypothetical protein L2E82_29682 [Cichorium intybus]